MIRLKLLPVLTLGILVLFAALIGGDMPYFILLIVLFSIALPLAHLLILSLSLKGEVKLPNEDIFVGDEIEITYIVTNKSPFTVPYLLLKRNISERLALIKSERLLLTLENKESFKKTDTFVAMKRGYYDIGDFEVELSDVFGIATIKRTLKTNAEFLVFPQASPLSSFDITKSKQVGELKIRSSRYQDKSRIHTIRDYVEGDSLRSIHWRLSAKKDIPVVKLFENRGDSDMKIVLDAKKIDISKDKLELVEDKLVDVALSLIEYSLRVNSKVNLVIVNDDKLVSISGSTKDDLKPFLIELAKFKLISTKDYIDSIYSLAQTLQIGSTIAFVTPRLLKEQGAQALYLLTLNTEPIIMSVTGFENSTSLIDAKVKAQLLKDGIMIYTIDTKKSTPKALEVPYV